MHPRSCPDTRKQAQLISGGESISVRFVKAFDLLAQPQKSQLFAHPGVILIGFFGKCLP